MDIPVSTDFTLHSEDFKPEWLKKTIHNAFEMMNEYHPATAKMETPAVSLRIVLAYIVYIAGFRRFEWDTLAQSPSIPHVHQLVAISLMGDRYMLETFYRIHRELIKLAIEGEISIFTTKVRKDGIQEFKHISRTDGEATPELISSLYMALVPSNLPNIYISYKKLPPIS